LRREGPHDGVHRLGGSKPDSVQLPGFHKGLASERRVARREAALSALVSLAGGGLLTEGRLNGQIRGDGRQENGDAGTLEGAKAIPQIGLELSYAGLKDVVPSRDRRITHDARHEGALLARRRLLILQELIDARDGGPFGGPDQQALHRAGHTRPALRAAGSEGAVVL